jgi:hypothetical protein
MDKISFLWKKNYLRMRNMGKNPLSMITFSTLILFSFMEKISFYEKKYSNSMINILNNEKFS